MMNGSWMYVGVGLVMLGSGCSALRGLPGGQVIAAPAAAAPAQDESKAQASVDSARTAMAEGKPDTAFKELAGVVDDVFKYSAVKQADVLPMLRQAADARVELRQKDFAADKTYDHPGREGRCFFSTEAFGPQSNASLRYRFSGNTQLHVRCFLKEDLTAYLQQGWETYLRLSINPYVGWGAPGKIVDEPGCKRCAVDASFSVPSAPITSDDFALIDAQAGVSRQKGLVKQGGKLVPAYDTRPLSYQTALLWERTAP